MVQAVALGGISVRFEESVVWPEHVVCFFRGALEDDDHEATHEERSINHLVGFLRRAVVENSILRIVFVLQKSGELTGKPMDHRQVERPEIFIEGEVSQVIVNVEEEGVLVVQVVMFIFGWIRRRDQLGCYSDQLGQDYRVLSRTSWAVLRTSWANSIGFLVGPAGLFLGPAGPSINVRRVCLTRAVRVTFADNL